MYPQPAGVAVRASLASIANASTPTAAELTLLRERVCAAVSELKTRGWPIERILVRLKEVASEVGLQPSRNSNLTAAEFERRKAVWADVITQCIEYYYGQDQAPPPELSAAQCNRLE